MADSTEPIHRQLGLTDDELQLIVEVLDREPNHLELALYSVMWSEHCSYKSSRIHLRRLPTTGERVLVGPGENAGVIDAGDGIALAIRIESHNHPSAIEPYQGAATGVGGILRDIFTMGARPIAVMDPLFFGPQTTPKQRWLLEGVVAGISGYGNSVGVPTIGGELTFDPCYSGNPLVNVLCLGALPTERLVLGIASGTGNLAVLLGSTTGRDGIGGVSVLASAGFSDDDDQSKRPSVQVGDPYEEKRLIEACLALLDEKLVVGIQDLGGAGLVCATSETAARGRVGMDVDVDAVPTREAGMEPWEIMTSESQERMLAIVTPEGLARVQELCARWEVRATVVGRVTEPDLGPDGEPIGVLRIRHGFDGEIIASVPASSLADDAPLYDRPLARPSDLDARHAAKPEAEPEGDLRAELLSLLVDPAFVYQQYDHQLFLNTVTGPGANAALLKLAGPGLPESNRGFALTTDSNPRWCSLDPRAGTALTLAESIANLACVGATPVAVVNCLNFGNPTHPEVMWQLSESIDGMAEGCNAFGLAVVGGNVSLYNESGGRDIDPTPVLGVLGLVDELNARPPVLAWNEGDTVVLVEAKGATTSLGGSRWAREIRGNTGGTLATLDAAAHQALCQAITTIIATQVAGGETIISAISDVSGGGLAVTLAEMARASKVGLQADLKATKEAFFGEGPSRFVVATNDVARLETALGGETFTVTTLGVAGGGELGLGDLAISIEELTSASAAIFAS
jgi:phosphoribosylformylglycinamidine synthase